MHSWQLTNALAALLIPPGLLIVLMAGGLALRGRYPRLGYLLLVGGLAGLYVCSTPITAHFLLRHWEGAPTTTEAISTAQVIIVLGGGKYPQAPEYGGDTVAGSTLVRLRYAAHLHRLTGRPIMVSGTPYARRAGRARDWRLDARESDRLRAGLAARLGTHAAPVQAAARIGVTPTLESSAVARP